MGVGPTYPVWKTGVLADVLRSHKNKAIQLGVPLKPFAELAYIHFNSFLLNAPLELTSYTYMYFKEKSVASTYSATWPYLVARMGLEPTRP